MIAELAMILPVMLLAAVIQSGTGFGFGLIAVGLLAVFMPVQEAALLNVVPALVLNLTLLWRLHGHLKWDDLRWIAPAIVLATPLGVVGLLALDTRMVYAILALVLGVAALQSIFGRPEGRPWHSFWLGIPMGALSGLLAGAYGTGGPPVIAYVQSHRYERHRHVACLQLLLAIAGTIRVISLLVQDALTSAQWLLSALSASVIPLGASIGLRLLRSLPQVWLRRGILAMLLVLMVNCALRAV
jgi:uncharacterized membrane protein YfcA